MGDREDDREQINGESLDRSDRILKNSGETNEKETVSDDEEMLDADRVGDDDTDDDVDTVSVNAIPKCGN
ncbi:hypothetical protein BG004_007792 [Podila humilis]|nr:hypothetical protein BG004_007792 [Podila humilis]